MNLLNWLLMLNFLSVVPSDLVTQAGCQALSVGECSKCFVPASRELRQGEKRVIGDKCPLYHRSVPLAPSPPPCWRWLLVGKGGVWAMLLVAFTLEPSLSDLQPPGKGGGFAPGFEPVLQLHPMLDWSMPFKNVSIWKSFFNIYFKKFSDF